MAKLVLDIAHAPFGHEYAYAGLFVAMAWVSIGNDVVVVMRGDGVYAARKGQGDTMKDISLPPTEKQVRDVLGEGGRIEADRESLEIRGIKPEELVEGVGTLTPEEIRRLMMEEGERVLSL